MLHYEIVNILKERDGISEEEAWALVNECQETIDDILLHTDDQFVAFEEVVDVIEDLLGLEPDYMDYFLHY